MVVRERFPIAELVARTGVPQATVHHYLRLGLLPPARRASANRFLYDDRHVQRLRLIRMLRARRGLPLSVIRRILPDLLELEREQAFRPEMWDRAVGLHLGRGSRRSPAARLLEAAKEAFARRGYGDVNVDDICKAARVAKGSFYRHYSSKEDLFFAAAEASAREVAGAMAEAVGEGKIAEEGAGEALAALLEPRLPIFMDLFARALQRRPGYAAAARRVFGGLAQEVGRLVSTDEEPAAAGARLVRVAVGRVFQHLMTPAVPVPGSLPAVARAVRA